MEDRDSRRAGRAVRGGRVQTDFGNGMLLDSIIVMGLDATLSKGQRQVDFDIDDVDRAVAELDRLHSKVEDSN